MASTIAWFVTSLRLSIFSLRMASAHGSAFLCQESSISSSLECVCFATCQFDAFAFSRSPAAKCANWSAWAFRNAARPVTRAT